MSFNEFIGEGEREIKADVNRLKQENSTLKKQLKIIRERIIKVLKHHSLPQTFSEGRIIPIIQDNDFEKIASEISGEESSD